MDDADFARAILGMRGLPPIPAVRKTKPNHRAAAANEVAVWLGSRLGLPVRAVVLCRERDLGDVEDRLRLATAQFRSSMALRRTMNTAHARAYSGAQGQQVTIMRSDYFADVTSRAKSALWLCDHFVLLGLPIEYEETVRELWPMATRAVLGDPSPGGA